jgi:hypothetical protein
MEIDVCYFADNKMSIRDFPHPRPDADDEGHGMVQEDAKEFVAAEAKARGIQAVWEVQAAGGVMSRTGCPRTTSGSPGPPSTTTGRWS